MTPRQLTLALDLAGKFTAEDFLIAPSNAAVHAALEAWPNWPAKNFLVVGPPGSGKSHLVAIWAERAGAPVYEGSSVTEELVAALEPGSALAVENIDVPGCPETVLFHLLNTGLEKDLSLVLTGCQPPGTFWPKLADLASRLRQMPAGELQPPDDGLVRAVLVKLFDDRQLAVDAEVIDYVARRMERSLGAARETVAALDQEALALGRRVTKPVAAAVLARLTSDVD